MFTHKSLVHQTKSRTPIFKYLTMFFLGASAVLLMTQAFDINTTLNNAVQYIGQIILTTDGSAIADTGIILDGSNGNAFFSGNVGIGVTTPSQSLEVNGNIALSTAGRIGATGNQVYMATDGNVGIGTNNPYYTLHIKSNDANKVGGLFLEGEDMSTIRFGAVGADPRTDLREIKKEGSGSELYIYYKDTTNTGVVSLATFTKSGYVGIGTTGPNEKLEVAGNIGLSDGADRTLKMMDRTTSTGDGWDFSIVGSKGLGFLGTNYYNGGDIFIQGGGPVTGDDYITGAYGDIILGASGGKVGIGITDPLQTLEVFGNIGLKGDNRIIKLADRTAGYNGDGYDLTIEGANGSVDPTFPLGGIGGSIFIKGGTPAGPAVDYGNVILSYPHGKVGIGTASPSAMLTVEGGIRPKSNYGGDPGCGTVSFPEGTIFYNDTLHSLCYCSSGGNAKTTAGASCE